jgi:hypothetical protein
MATLCLHCDAALTAKDLRDGWCDSCGKRLPSSLIAKPRPAAPRPVARPADGEPIAVGWIVLAVFLVVALAYLGTTAYLAGDGGLAPLLKVALRAAVVLLVAVPLIAFRAARAR